MIMKRFLASFVLIISAFFYIAAGAEMSIQQAKARITLLPGDVFQVEMMPAEGMPRLIKKGDKNFAAYKKEI